MALRTTFLSAKDKKNIIKTFSGVGGSPIFPRSSVVSASGRGLQVRCSFSSGREEQSHDRKDFKKKAKKGLKIFAYTSAAVGVGAILWGQRYRFRSEPEAPPGHKKARIVVLGTGWGAVPFVKDINTNLYEVIVVSPRNYFLFTPLLPSTTVGTIEPMSITEPIRDYCMRNGKAAVQFYEAECTDIDPYGQTVTCKDSSEMRGSVASFKLDYDYLVMAVGAETATFGIPGVKEHTHFLKELADARGIRTHIMDCFEAANFPGQPKEEVDRLLHFVVVGGGPTGVEYAAELRDFMRQDLENIFPHLIGQVKITLIEALPHILGMFDKKLIDYTEKMFAHQDINILSQSAVTRVDKQKITVRDMQKNEIEIPFGLAVWATGNAPRAITRNTVAKLPPSEQNLRRGIVADEWLRVKGTPYGNMWALGDCSATPLAATAQVASQQGKYLARVLNDLAYLAVPESAAPTPQITHVPSDQPQPAVRVQPDDIHVRRVQNVSKLPKFVYNHFGSFAYIGGEMAVLDIPSFGTPAGTVAYFFWKSAYLSSVFNTKNKLNVAWDWTRAYLFGRDISRTN